MWSILIRFFSNKTIFLEFGTLLNWRAFLRLHFWSQKSSQLNFWEGRNLIISINPQTKSIMQTLNNHMTNRNPTNSKVYLLQIILFTQPFDSFKWKKSSLIYGNGSLCYTIPSVSFILHGFSVKYKNYGRVD